MNRPVNVPAAAGPWIRMAGLFVITFGVLAVGPTLALPTPSPEAPDAVAGAASEEASVDQAEALRKAALLDAMLGEMTRRLDETGNDEPAAADPLDGFDLVNNNLDKAEGTFFDLYRNEDELIAALDPQALDRPFLLSSTMSAGPFLTGFQLGSLLVEWRRQDDRLHLIEPEIRYLADESDATAESVRRTYTDRYLLSTPIVGESGGRVLISLTDLLRDESDTLLGGIGSLKRDTVSVSKAKAFAQNIEVGLTGAHSDWIFEGGLATIHYSFSALPDASNFEMRAADQRVGYWVHAARDYSIRAPFEDKFVRSIERWRLEKADPALSMSPPREPIVFYIEKTVPLPYRRYVREGILAWNEAFREIGIDGAIEVRQQTETRYNDIDPEDIRYNFVRWVTSGGGFAIALHRADPRTGEILDADILIDDSWVDVWIDEYPLMLRQAWAQRMQQRVATSPDLAPAAAYVDRRLQAFGLTSPMLHEAVKERRPERLSLAERRAIVEQFIYESDRGALGRRSRGNASCSYASQLGHHMAKAQLAYMMADAPSDSEADPTTLADLEDALAQLGMTIEDLPEDIVADIKGRVIDPVVVGPTSEEEAEEEETLARADVDVTPQEVENGETMLNGVPERLIGQNLIALTAHEVGHVLGLRHNFEASMWKPVEAIESYDDPSDEPPVASVMDYCGTFIAEPGRPQGLYNMVRVGPYDRWAIKYGYAFVDDPAELDEILAESVEPAHAYGTDEDLYSLDPGVMTYDIGSDPVASRERQLRILDHLRSKLLDRMVQDGESWVNVRKAFMRLWFDEVIALWDSTGYIGGSWVSRDHNVEGARRPLRNVEADVQRGVLDMLIERVLAPDAYEFPPELLNSFQVEKWYQPAFSESDGSGTEAFSVHNQVNMLQFAIISDLLFFCTPRLYDQELRSTDSNALTVPELHRTVSDAIWSEFLAAPSGGLGDHTNINPMVPALRRNLQREHAEQLIDLAYRVPASMPTQRQPQIVAMSELRRIADLLEPWADAARDGGIDDYTRIHLEETLVLVREALSSRPERRL